MYLILLVLSCYKNNSNFKNVNYKTNFPFELTEAIEKKDEDKVISLLEDYEKTGKLYTIRGTVEELNTTIHMYILERWRGHTSFFDRLIEETLPLDREYLLKEGYYAGNILHYIICRANSSTLEIFLEKLKRNSISLFNLIDINKVVNLKTFQFMAPFKNLNEDILLTPLMLAIQVNDIEMVKILLNNKANPNEIQLTKGVSALIFATIHGRKEIVQLLLDSGADFTHITLDKTHEDKAIKNLSAIMWATKSSQKEIIDLLIAYDRRGIVRKYYRNEIIKKRLKQTLIFIGKLTASILLGQLKADGNLSLEGSFDLTAVEKFIQDALEDMKQYKEEGTWLRYYPYFDEKEDVDYYLKHFSKMSRNMNKLKAKYEEREKNILVKDDKRALNNNINAILSKKCNLLKEKLLKTMENHQKVKNHIESLTLAFDSHHRSFSYKRNIENIREECEKIILESKERNAEFECFMNNPAFIERDIDEKYNYVSLEGLRFSPKGLISNRRKLTYAAIKNIEEDLKNYYDSKSQEGKVVFLDLISYRDLIQELQKNYQNSFIPTEEQIIQTLNEEQLDKDKKYWIKKSNNFFNYYFNGKLFNCLGIEKDIYGVLISE